MPLARPPVVVEVEHGGDRVHAQAVDVVFLRPVDGVGDEKALHLVAADVKAACAPGLVLHAILTLKFVERCAVEFVQPVFILREVGGDPVEDHADPRAVCRVDQCHEVVRRAEARGRRIVAADLIAPRAVEGMLRHRHQLDVRVTHVADVGNKLVGKLTVGVEAAVGIFLPRACVDLVYVHRAAVEIILMCGALAQPGVVLPFVAVQLAEDARVVRAKLRAVAVGVGLVDRIPVSDHLVLVLAADLEGLVREQTGEDAVVLLHRHGFIPAVEVAHQVDRVGVRRPYAEADAAVLGVRAEIFVGLIVGSLCKEVFCKIALVFCHSVILSPRGAGCFIRLCRCGRRQSPLSAFSPSLSACSRGGPR